MTAHLVPDYHYCSVHPLFDYINFLFFVASQSVLSTDWLSWMSSAQHWVVVARQVRSLKGGKPHATMTPVHVPECALQLHATCHDPRHFMTGHDAWGALHRCEVPRRLTHAPAHPSVREEFVRRNAGTRISLRNWFADLSNARHALGHSPPFQHARATNVSYVDSTGFIWDPIPLACLGACVFSTWSDFPGSMHASAACACMTKLMYCLPQWQGSRITCWYNAMWTYIASPAIACSQWGEGPRDWWTMSRVNCWLEGRARDNGLRMPRIARVSGIWYTRRSCLYIRLVSDAFLYVGWAGWPSPSSASVFENADSWSISNGGNEDSKYPYIWGKGSFEGIGLTTSTLIKTVVPSRR